MPKFSHYSVGDKNYGDNFASAWSAAEEAHGTLTRNWLVNDNWSLNLSLLPVASEIQQQQKFIKLNKAQVGELRNQLKAALDPNQSPNGKLCDDFLRETIKNLPGSYKAGKNIMDIFERYATSRRGFFYVTNSYYGQNKRRAELRNAEIRLDFAHIKTRERNGFGFPSGPDDLVLELIHELLHGVGRGNDPDGDGLYNHEEMGRALIRAGATFNLFSEIKNNVPKAGEDILRKACSGSKGWNTNNTPLDNLLKQN